jgi:hypothetical protein
MHGISTIDRVDSINSTWHGLETIRTQEELNTFEGSALDTPLEFVPLFTGQGIPAQRIEIQANGAEKTVQLNALMSGEHTLNTSYGSYPLVPNKEIFETISYLVEEMGYNVKTVGSIHGRRKIFWTLETSDSEFEVGEGDKLVSRICLVSSHDSSEASRWFESCVRIVCSNTFRYSVDSAKGKDGFNESLRKSKTVQSRFADIASKVNQFAANKILLHEGLKTLADQSLSKEEITQFSAGISGLKELSTKSLNVAQRIDALANTGKGNKGETRFDALNGVTEYYTHETNKDASKAFISSEFGTGSQAKSKALEILMDDERLEKVCAQGERLLNEFEGVQERKQSAKLAKLRANERAMLEARLAALGA